MEKCIDISKHQDKFNAALAKKEGATTVICRLAYGITADTMVEKHIAEAKRCDLMTGGYGFATWHYKSNNGGSVDVARGLMRKQMNLWIKTAKALELSSWFVIDEELEPGKVMGLSRYDNTMLLCEAAKMAEDTGLHVCLYGSASWIKTYVNLDTFKLPLWVAYYPAATSAKDFDNIGATFPAASGTYGLWMNSVKERICMWQFSDLGFATKYGATGNYLDKDWLYFHPVVYFAKYTGTSNSIVDALKAIGEKSDYAYRKQIAAVNGAKDYSGTSVQNLALLALLKAGKLVRP